MCDTLVDFSLLNDTKSSSGGRSTKKLKADAELAYDPDTKKTILVLKDCEQSDPTSQSDQVFDITEYDKLFDFETHGRYKAFRNKMQDPITCTNLTDQNAFKFYHVWDCLTGERLGIDPYGPLYISPVTILQTIYHNILKGLWIEFDDCLPMYGENLGCGESFYIPGKGEQPEKYLFRFPIKDCYIYNDQDNSIHTMGPKFTLQELKEIDRIIVEYWYDDPFVENLNEFCTMVRLKEYYDVAICKKPTLIEPLPAKINEYYLTKIALNHIGQDVNHDTYLNHVAVDMIKELIGYRSRY